MSLPLLGAESHTRRRLAAGAHSLTGDWVEGASTDTTFTGSLQPLSGHDLKILPEGLRESVTCKVYCASGTLQTADQSASTSPDLVVVASGVYAGTYQVVNVAPQTAILPHDRAYLTRVSESE